MIPLFESLFIPHDRHVYCKECRRVLIRVVKLRFSQYRLTPIASPIYESAYWEAQCAEGHHCQQRVDRNVVYILLNPDDFVQYGDPRFAKIYPLQYAKMRAEEEETKRRNEEINEATEIADKQLTRQFGARAEEALEILKEKHPEYYKVKTTGQPQRVRSGIKPRVLQ